MKRAIAATLLALLSSMAEADPMRLGDLVATAVRQAPELAHARLDLAVARASALRARGIEDVHVGANAQIQADRSSSISVVGNDSQRVVGAGASVSKLLSTGGTLGLALDGSRTQTKAALDGVTRVGYESSISVSLTQPLLRGAGAATVEAPIRAADLQTEATHLAAEARARDLVVALARAYHQVELARAQLEVRKLGLESARKQQELTEGQIRAEKVARSELLAVQEAIAVHQQDVIAAEQTILERSLALRELAGLELVPDAIAIETEPLPPLPAGDLELATLLATATERSVVLAGLAAAERIAATNLAGAEGTSRDRLDLQVAAGPLATGSTFGGAVANTVELGGYAVQASLVFDRAIQHRTERGSIAIARTALERARIDQRAARLHLAVTATRAVQRAHAATASFDLGVKAIALAEQNIEAEQHRFELGKSTNFDVLRRQDELEQVRLRNVAFVVDYLDARADLDGLTGEILAKYGVVMP